jgi:hypothetical protein
VDLRFAFLRIFPTLLLADAKSLDSGSRENSLIAINLLGISLINPESIARTASISSAA